MIKEFNFRELIADYSSLFFFYSNTKYQHLFSYIEQECGNTIVKRLFHKNQNLLDLLSNPERNSKSKDSYLHNKKTHLQN